MINFLNMLAFWAVTLVVGYFVGCYFILLWQFSLLHFDLSQYDFNNWPTIARFVYGLWATSGFFYSIRLIYFDE